MKCAVEAEMVSVLMLQLLRSEKKCSMSRSSRKNHTNQI